MKKATLIALLSSLTIATAWCQKQTVTTLKNGFNFQVIGDWGRKGQFNQKEVAKGMSIAAAQVEPEFIISTGDNFYPNGVASTQDPQWMSSFENVYTDFLLNCNWWSVLGNHDYRGNVQAQIDYTHISRRWNMPNRYYSITKTTDDGSRILFVFADTNPLNDAYYSSKKYKDRIKNQDTARQINWIKRTLAQSNADWKIVIGHHPFYTGGKRKHEESAVRKNLEHIFTKNNVDIYFAGHEHDLQVIQPATPTLHIISGAGSEIRPTSRTPQTRFAKATPGFAQVSITKEVCLIQLVNTQGTVIYEYQLKKK